MTEIESALSKLLADTNFPAELGIALVSAADGNCIVEVPSLAKTERPGGIMAGYVLIAAADIAAWLAIKTLLGIEDGSVTSDLHTAFVRAAVGPIRCEAEVIRCGRRLALVGAHSRDDAGRIVARHTVTYARRDGEANRP